MPQSTNDFVDRGTNNMSAHVRPAEQFMLEMIKVPKREQRLQGMLYKQLLQARQEDMRSMAGLINSACLDVRLSRRLKKLLGIILKLGNQLNEVWPLLRCSLMSWCSMLMRVVPSKVATCHLCCCRSLLLFVAVVDAAAASHPPSPVGVAVVTAAAVVACCSTLRRDSRRIAQPRL